MYLIMSIIETIKEWLLNRQLRHEKATLAREESNLASIQTKLNRAEEVNHVRQAEEKADTH